MRVGDIVVNGWASDENPQKVGVFIGMSGRYRVFTNNGKKKWRMDTKEGRQLVVGHLDLSPLHEAMEKAANGAYHVPLPEPPEKK